MNPIAVFRFAPTEGPGHFASYLERRALNWQLHALDEGAAVPGEARGCSGMVLMGGPMSANDPLPWVPKILDLVRDAVRNGVPVLGHCLGAQLMARALGGEVSVNRYREIGWGAVEVQNNVLAVDWFGDESGFEAFHWHGETFSVPPGATRVLANAHCRNQGFVTGIHLGLQCHIEMTPDLIASWCESGREELAAHAGSPAVQAAVEIRRDLDERLAALHRIADRVYDKWTEGLVRV